MPRTVKAFWGITGVTSVKGAKVHKAQIERRTAE